MDDPVLAAVRELHEWAERHPRNVRQGIGDALVDRLLAALR